MSNSDRVSLAGNLSSKVDASKTCIEGGRDDLLEIDESIRAFLRNYVDSYMSGNVDALRPFFVSDSMIFANGRPIVHGWESVRNMFADSFENFHIGAKVDLQEVEVFGDTAFIRFLTHVRLQPREPGDIMRLYFRDFAIIRRKNSSWVIMRNIDQPIDEARWLDDIKSFPPLCSIHGF